MGESGVATVVLSKGQAGNPVTANLSWGMGVLFATFMTRNISGGLFNPAIVIGWAFLGKLPWRKVIPYSLAQLAGGILGAAIVHALYFDAINAFDGDTRSIGPNGTASIFATYPRDNLSLGGAIFDQILATAVLVVAVLATIDPKNQVPADMIPIAVGLYVMSNGYMFSYNAGGGINPARDLGPRIWTAIAGWGPGVFSYWNYAWFWIPMLCPCIGAVLGSIVYYAAIGIHWPETDGDADEPPVPTIAVRGVSSDGFYISQQNMKFLESLAKRDSVLPVVR